MLFKIALKSNTVVLGRGFWGTGSVLFLDLSDVIWVFQFMTIS